MRELKLDLPEEPIPSDVLSVLQLHALNAPLLPNLKSLELKEATADLIPFIPLFLSHMTTNIEILFDTAPPAVMVASMIINLPKLCPRLESISLNPLPRDSTITNAASEMFLACNLEVLRHFLVDTPLTEEASQIVFQLPNLLGLWAIFTEPTSLLKVSLPGLTELDIEYHHGHDWLKAFHGTTLSKLTEVTFNPKCNQIGNLLESFESVALATSAAATISQFRVYTSCSWDPGYRSLLAFRQLKELVIEFSCHHGCSSRIDDDIVITLAQAMPKLETLQIGGAPCHVPSNVTIHGLIAFAHHCLDLSRLRIHFQTDSLIVALANEGTPSPPKSYLPREDCALAILEVGEIPIPHQYTLPAVLTLLHIFPQLRAIEYVNEDWAWVADTVGLSKKIDCLVRRSGKLHPLYLQLSVVTPRQYLRSMLRKWTVQTMHSSKSYPTPTHSSASYDCSNSSRSLLMEHYVGTSINLLEND
jgi:hypothetical protein